MTLLLFLIRKVKENFVWGVQIGYVLFWERGDEQPAAALMSRCETEGCSFMDSLKRVAAARVAAALVASQAVPFRGSGTKRGFSSEAGGAAEPADVREGTRVHVPSCSQHLCLIC